MISEMYTTGEIPQDVELNRMTCLPMTSNAQKCEEYRAPSLMSHESKKLSRIINHQMEKKIENLQEDQSGFP